MNNVTPEIIEEIVDFLVEYGQRDPKFKVGDIIKYSPSEIGTILSRAINTRGRINDLAQAIMNHSGHCVDINIYIDSIRKCCEEILQLCDMAEFINRSH